MIYNLIMSGCKEPFTMVKLKDDAKVEVGHNIRFKDIVYRVNHIELTNIYVSV